MFKKNILFLFLLFISLNYSCGKYIIKEPTEKNRENYDKDNIVYKPGKVFRYLVNTIEGSYFKNIKNIKYIELKVIGGVLPFYNFDKDYNQTVIQYIYLDENLKVIGSEKTGVIENTDNIWIHPPRWEDFSILNTNSYPFLINESNLIYWNWNLNNTFDDTVLVNKNYYKKKKNDSNIILLVKTKNLKGKSYSKYIFNNDNLIIEMDFINYDKSRIKFKLIQE